MDDRVPSDAKKNAAGGRLHARFIITRTSEAYDEAGNSSARRAAIASAFSREGAMMLKRLGLCLTLIGLALPLWAGGIAMRFVDITLEKVNPGDTFNLRTLKNLPLVVINQDDERSIDVLIETVLPERNEMKQGYEPIPTPTWIQIVPNRFHLGPKASASADVIVTIPNDPKLVGHHYRSDYLGRTPRRATKRPTAASCSKWDCIRACACRSERWGRRRCSVRKR